MEANSSKEQNFYQFLQTAPCSRELTVVMKNWYDLIVNQHDGDDSTLTKWHVNIINDPGENWPLAVVEVEYPDGHYQKSFYQKDLQS